jgi:DNA invertase Pin-like site-specific DNA recombinase
MSPTGAAVFHGYVRVSTDDQAGSGLGLSAQRQAISEACRLRSWGLHTVFEDAASGRSLDGRPGLQEALTSVNRGEAAGLIVAKLDRLSRSLLDFAGLMEQSRREGWALVALDLGVDTSTPQGELMATVLASFAQFERRLIGQRTKEALAELKASGVQLGRPRLVGDDVVAYVQQLRFDGLTMRQAADRLNTEGVPTGTGSGQWFGSTVSRLLKSRAGSSLDAAPRGHEHSPA